MDGSTEILLSHSTLTYRTYCILYTFLGKDNKKSRRPRHERREGNTAGKKQGKKNVLPQKIKKLSNTKKKEKKS